MAVYQMFLRLLDGTTRLLLFSSPTVSGLCVKQSLSQLTKIPLHLIRLVSGNRAISDETLVSASEGAFFPTLYLLLRLGGGKGGFASLLRSSAGAQRRTNNFDSCCDLSGRRLREANEERRLEEWKAEAEERKLEKMAESFLKRKAAEGKKSGADKYAEECRQVSTECREATAAAVKDSFELYMKLKRKAFPGSDMPSKKTKIWTGRRSEESDIDDSDSQADD